MKNNTLEEITSLIKKSDNIVISGHISPDGDSIGATFALTNCLKKIFKHPKILIEEYNSKFDILEGSEFIYKGDKEELNIDLFISLDCGDINRLGDNIDLFKNAKNTIVIDHHISNNYFGEYNYIKTNASSTCEIVFEIIEKLTSIDESIASCIYVGLVTDTGGFRHNSTSPHTLTLASKLLEFNIPFSKIYNEIMYVKTISEVKAFSKIVSEVNIYEDISLAYTSITLEEMESLNITHKDLDGIGEIILNIKGVSISVFAYQRVEGDTKISFRSKEKDVNKIASYFGGGGHKNASGCTIEALPNKALEIVIEKIKSEF